MIKKRDMKPFIANRRLLWTPVAILALAVLPFWYMAVVLYEERREFITAAKQMIDLLLWRVEK